jgi:hypothetical protein
MFGFFKGAFKDGKILALADLAVAELSKGNNNAAKDYFETLSEYPFEDIQKAFMGNIKLLTEKGDIEDILDSTTVGLPENTLELITLVWKDDVDEIMAYMGNDKEVFIGIFATIVGALQDSNRKRKLK